jgi:hypothetical protein
MCFFSPDTPHLASVISPPGKSDNTPLVQCTSHMCPIRVHWHVKLNYKEYWRVKVTVTNFNYRMNYSLWNMVVQHPNFDNLTKIFSFQYKSLTPYEGLSKSPNFLCLCVNLYGSLFSCVWDVSIWFYFADDTAMLWGVKFYNDFLSQAGPLGNVQSELLFRKDKSTFTFEKGWAFPRRIYFNGDNCVMPPPDAYPWLPNDSSRPVISLLLPVMTLFLSMAFLFAHVWWIMSMPVFKLSVVLAIKKSHLVWVTLLGFKGIQSKAWMCKISKLWQCKWIWSTITMLPPIC